jgi:hypothetical protein
MSDVSNVIDGYVAIWNETDPARRRAINARTWSSDASYLDPMLAGDRPDGIDAMIAAVHQQLPGHQLRLAGPVDAHHDRVRFAWEIVGPDDAPVFAGVDFGTLASDGRLRAITGFLDRVPEQYLKR